jgi:glutamate synthase (NADPH/NADH) small chain
MAVEKMLKFVTVARDMPEKRPPNLRARDFDEIYGEYAIPKAEEQAGRCSLLPDALPAAQQHPRLAAHDCRGASAGSL